MRIIGLVVSTILVTLFWCHENSFLAFCGFPIVGLIASRLDREIDKLERIAGGARN